MILRRYFDRIAIISLPARVERRQRLLDHLVRRGLADDSDLTWVEAVDGHRELPPEWWRSGNGAWGCRASHWCTIAAARRDGVERLLVLEDDAFFHRRTPEWLAAVFPLLPADWDLFFLGGQHLGRPLPTADPRLIAGGAITRTHAWAIQSRAFGKLLLDIGNDSIYRNHPGWHIDHHLGDGQTTGKWSAYAPAWWFAAQDEGASDISSNQDARRWWQLGNHHWQLPFVVDDARFAGSDWLHRRQGTPPEDRLRLALWLRDAAREAWQQGRLPACSLPAETLRRLWPAGVRQPRDEAELAHLADYPANGLFPHPFSPAPTTPNQTT